MGKHLPSDSQLHTGLSFASSDISPSCCIPPDNPIIADSQLIFPTLVSHIVCTSLTVSESWSSLYSFSPNKKLISLALHDLDEAWLCISAYSKVSRLPIIARLFCGL